MRSSSRYFATVRRAIRIPSRASSSESRASESGWAGSSASTRAWILLFTASDETSSPADDAMAEWKKNFIGTRPRGVVIHLFETTRETVDSCMPMSSATSRRTSGSEVRDAVVEEVALLADDRLGDPDDRPLPLVEALHEPLRRAHLLAEVAPALAVEGAVARLEHPPVERRDPQAREAVVVEEDDVVVLDLHDRHVGLDVDRPGRVVPAARPRIELADPRRASCWSSSSGTPICRARSGRRLRPEVRKAVRDELHEERRRDVGGPRLEEEHLGEVPPADADRVERLEERERLSRRPPSGTERPPQTSSSVTRR